MQSIITSYLLQTGKCALPEIGFFKFKHKPAEYDVVNKQLLPPSEEITYSEQAIFLSPGLVHYLAEKKGLPINEAEGLLYNFCREWRERLDTGEAFCFETIGCLQKNEHGIFSFEKDPIHNYFQPVPAERVLHEKVEHTVLVGDKETTSTVMSEYYKEETPAVKRGWVVGAIILAAIGLMVLIYSFYIHKGSGIGNRNHIKIKPASETYFKP